MKNYKNIITLSKNARGIWDLDPSKGCASGVSLGQKGCYNDCYAAKKAKIYGYDFSKTVFRHFRDIRHERQIIRKINKIDMPFIRMGCSGDPSEDWGHTISIICKIARANKEIVIITKHWQVLTDSQLGELEKYKVCINTSVSALDEESQRKKCLLQYNRLKPFCKSFLRIVSCDFNKENDIGAKMAIIQEWLFKNESTIDTVFRASKSNSLVVDGVINVKMANFLGGKALVSKLNRKAYLGKCESCIEKCGVFNEKFRRVPELIQTQLFN